MSSHDLAEQVIDHVRRNGPSKAFQIAAALGVDRPTINRLLYGQLRGKLKQSSSYVWSLLDSENTPNDREPTENTFSKIFRYYLDCLSRDDDSGIRVFADSHHDLDYIELENWPSAGDLIAPHSDALRSLVNRQRQLSRKKTLWLGYPAYIRHVQGRNGWEGAFLAPILIWPHDSDSHELAFLPEPMINTKALEGLTTGGGSLEEAAWLAEELGLDSWAEPPIDELVARLRDLRPEWEWKEATDPASLRQAGELRSLSETGIYNSAVVVLTDRSPYTIGLERELADLQKASDASIEKSSLGIFLGQKAEKVDIDGPLLEPVPLNAEQQAAVRRALSDSLSVITGPPGTGKSQVVTSILVNAAWRGLRVLFASKNNKAVDVVMQRVNSLAVQPVLLRLGTRSLQEELSNQLTAILSAQATDEERQAYSISIRDLLQANAVLSDIEKQVPDLIALRNKVDQLERACEGARGLLPTRVFREAAGVSVSEAEAKIKNLILAIRRADQRQASPFEKLTWVLLRKARLKQLDFAIQELLASLTSLGLHLTAGNADKIVLDAQASIDAIRSVAAYQAALEELASKPQLGLISKQIAIQNKSVAELSSDVWRNWSLLLPDRLTESDRSALGDYAGILRTIVRAEEEGGNVASQIWKRYYELASRTTKALPCWAVTSLSARGRVPFTPAEFDLVVIDEASQCDIASALPLLYRAKRAVVIGDPQQLRHISRLSSARDQIFMVKHDLLTVPGPSWGYRGNALYDLAVSRAKPESIVVLRDHHRSHADIINFSNDFFYKGKLRVATDYRRLKRPDGPAIRWIDIQGGVTKPRDGGALNRIEAEAVIRELKRIAIEQRFLGEIGVVTPFRAQANLIDTLISADGALAAILASRNFISETAHKFQGDERDLIVFSPVVSRDMPQSAYGFLRSQGNIFNVGITRARGALIVVGDASACAFSEVEYLRAFVQYVTQSRKTPSMPDVSASLSNGLDYPPVARPELVSKWERTFYSALLEAGFRPIPQFDVDQYVLDFALIRPNGRKLNIEIDGEKYHKDWDGELIRRDQLRNLRLIEMGWDVLRLWVYEVRDNLPGCIGRVKLWVEEADGLPPYE